MMTTPTVDALIDQMIIATGNDHLVNQRCAEQEHADEDKRKPKIADILCNLVLENAELFVAQDGKAYAFTWMDDRRECHCLQSGQFADFMTALYHARYKTIPGGAARQDALSLLRWEARKTKRDTFVRIASCAGKVYIDLGTPHWNAIEIDAAGWRIVQTPPVAFKRNKATQPLPDPVHCTNVDLLHSYLNIEPEHWPMVAAWVVAALHPRGPYPVLVFAGEQGTAKSTSIKVLKHLIDPAVALLRGQPEEVRDLMIGASNSWLLAFDNVSVLYADVSDALCMISTGGGYAKRALFTDDDELLIDVARPIAMNGIGDVVTRPDLMDRCILVVPPVIPDNQRRDESAFWQAFERDRPYILGAFLNALSVALRRLPTVQLDTLPRMADFAKLAVAADPALRTNGHMGFLDAYAMNREEAIEIVIESSPLGEKLRELVLMNGKWEGTATQLLAALNEKATDSERRSKAWPSSANKLKTPLQRLAPSLRQSGVDMVFDRNDPRGSKMIRLTRVND